MDDLFLVPKLDTDKLYSGLMEEYKSLLGPLVHRPVTLLEIGVKEGGSILYWDSYLKHGESRIIGIDLALPDIPTTDRVSLCQCDQNDRQGLLRIARAHEPFDLIIDDASHQAGETRICFETLYPFLRPGGYYVIEDWAVGYFGEQFPQYQGMVEVITDLVERHPSWRFETFRIICEPGKAMACFQKGAAA